MLIISFQWGTVKEQLKTEFLCLQTFETFGFMTASFDLDCTNSRNTKMSAVGTIRVNFGQTKYVCYPFLKVFKKCREFRKYFNKKKRKL